MSDLTNTNESVNLMEFTRFTQHTPAGDHPEPRSGHRVFLDQDYLYIIGWFKRAPVAHIFKEVISINLFTKKWRRMNLQGEFPTCLASFSLVQRSPLSNQLLVFGGTGADFGNEISNSVHLLTIDGKKNICYSTKLPVFGNKIPTYGHAMVCSQTKKDTFYVIGGTTGRDFFFDVDELSVKNGVWTWTKLHEWTGEGGRYRLEAVAYGNRIFCFGGGTPSEVKEFDMLLVFDLEKNAYVSLQTYPDEEQLALRQPGYPPRRRKNNFRCHSATQWGHYAVDLYSCVWLFDLNTLRWKKHKFDLPRALFFHDAVTTQDGHLIVWGGVVDKLASLRTNECFALWLQPPPLYFLAASTMSHHPKVAAAKDELRSNDPVKIYLWIMPG
ncbi:hypothetical protein WR25_05919 [Diploscapter pachys]|uniref:Kelch repeat protein n=1 Tax=Diploscapter pachys TaxID=2018661 RepID=A0A2A2KVK2_9BILA|nr:hypothetical protein WR25_05919 [Diploscapter pachys]